MYKILIADDEELELKSMHIFLGRNYPEIEVLPDAVNGMQVVERVIKSYPDILILDIEMPGLDGLKALQLLREQGYDGHVIIKTAYSRFAYAQEALHLHVDSYLLKPVKKSELKERLDTIFAQLQLKSEEDKKEGSGRKSFTSGFILSLIFPKEKYKEIFSEKPLSGFREELPRRLSLICDFTLCPAEQNVLPIVIYSSSVMDEYNYRQLTTDIPEILNDLCMAVFGLKPEIGTSCLITDIYEQLPRAYYSALEQSDRGWEKEDMELGSQHLNKVLSYINQNFTEDISLENAAAFAKINPSYLSHLFKQHLNKNFVDYLTYVRMEHAITLIKTGTDKVNELSEKVGYQYPSYFCKQFKKYTGYTVGEYKRLGS